MKTRADYRSACKAHPEGWQAYREFDNGGWALRTGHGVRLNLDGYPLPDKQHDRARVDNADVRLFSKEQLAAEWSALQDAGAAYERLKKEGLKCIQICLPIGGTVEWCDWSKERREAVSRMIMYGS